MAKTIDPLKNHPLFKKAEKILSYSKIKNSMKKETYIVRGKKLKKK